MCVGQRLRVGDVEVESVGGCVGQRLSVDGCVGQRLSVGGCVGQRLRVWVGLWVRG